MSNVPPHQRSDLPPAVIELATRLGARNGFAGSLVSLTQTGRMKRALGTDTWMTFTARQSIEVTRCNFTWRARFAPFGLVAVCDALETGIGRLDVNALGYIPMVRTPHTPALMRGELMRYLAELPWAPDAILVNPALRWREGNSGDVVVSAGEGADRAEVSFGLDGEGRIATAFAPDRPRSAVDPILPTPWRGRFSDYRHHQGSLDPVRWRSRLGDRRQGRGVLAGND